MAINLALAPQPSRLEWPENCRIGYASRRQVEHDWHEAQAPQQRQRDDIAELRAVVSSLQQEVQSLRANVDKFRGAYNRTVKHLGDAVEALNLLMFGEPESLPKSKDDLAGFTPHIVKMIRSHACTKEIGERLAELEKRPAYIWKGPHIEGTPHEPGHLVQRGGNVWLCTAASTGIPGKSEDYCLFVRSGRDGRDAVRKEPVLK